MKSRGENMKFWKLALCASTLAVSAVSAQAEVNHIVLFDLTDDSPEAVQALLDGSWEYLSTIEGVTHFEVGARQPQRDTGNVMQDYDVMLSVTLDTEEHHVAYDSDPSHMAYIAKIRENWAGARVIDTTLGAKPEPVAAD